MGPLSLDPSPLRGMLYDVRAAGWLRWYEMCLIRLGYWSLEKGLRNVYIPVMMVMLIGLLFSRLTSQWVMSPYIARVSCDDPGTNVENEYVKFGHTIEECGQTCMG